MRSGRRGDSRRVGRNVTWSWWCRRRFSRIRSLWRLTNAALGSLPAGQLTVMLPAMPGWMVQWYAHVPRLAKFNTKV